MIWYAPKMFRGATVAVLGGGPSLTASDVVSVRAAGLRIIGVNDNYRFGNLIDMCFWGDTEWYAGTETHPGHAAALEHWNGMKVTCAPGCVDLPDVFGLVPTINPGLWPSPCCRWYRNSGLSAIGLAVTLGATRIVLLGFDGQSVAGQTHWHNSPVNCPTDDVFEQHRKSAIELAADITRYAGNRSVQVWNATPNSAYCAFPSVELSDFLKGVSGER